jgi:RHS repeat-associated protein
MIETRNYYDEVIKQNVWGKQYVDEILQVGINTDPGDDDDVGTGGVQDNCETYYYAVQDANYNVMGLVNSTGDLVERYEYTPYGRRRVFINAGSDPLCTSEIPHTQGITVTSTGLGDDQIFGLCDNGHQGLMHDKEFGLIYNRARYLHPVLGRFVNRDPIRYADGMNLYEYVGSKPVRFRDPTGLTVSERKMWKRMLTEAKAGGFNDDNARGLPFLFRRTTVALLEDLIKYNEWQEYDWNTSGQTKQQMYNHRQEQKLRDRLRSRLAIDAATGFVVVESSLEQNDLKLGRALGFVHADIFYNGIMIRKGMGGGLSRRVDAATDKRHWVGKVYMLKRLRKKWVNLSKPYILEAGSASAKGKCCKDVTDQEIEDCIRKYPNRKHVNCQHDVTEALFGCCLKGYQGIGSIIGLSEQPKYTSRNRAMWYKDNSTGQPSPLYYGVPTN